MKNKAFTLIELLAVITIIAIISAIGVISYQNIMTSSKMKSYTSYETTMRDSAIKQMDKLNSLKIMEFKYLALSDLVKEKYLEPIKDPFDNNSQTSCLNNSYELVIRCDNPESEYNTSGYNMLYIDCLKCSSGYQTEFMYKKTSLNIGNNNTGNNVCTLTKDKIEVSQVNTLCNNKMILDGDV